MIYPQNFEEKIGFDKVRSRLSAHCLSTLGKEMVEAMTFCDKADIINTQMQQVRQLRHLMEETENFPLEHFIDMRESLMRIRPENTHLEEQEVFDLMRSQNTIIRIKDIILSKKDDSYNEKDLQQKANSSYPELQQLVADIMIFPQVVRRINLMLDKEGKIKDGASFTLARIRDELRSTNGRIASTLNSILHRAKMDGLVDSNASPTMRDGRLMLPVSPAAKKKIQGIIHDESATGKTIFIEPAEVVAVNNRIRELEAEEKREMVRILTDFTKEIRPYIYGMRDSYQLLADIDFIQAKLKFSDEIGGCEPHVAPYPQIDWVQAQHPLLKKSLERQNKKIVPLDITLTKDKRIMIISGPNAGGKSICLKTTGLIQYILQCGLPIPVRENSQVGVFSSIMLDIGDEQSIENDLSTYSSHLINMKSMMKHSNDSSLLLIDEFGGGTEPNIGGALAESFLEEFLNKKAWAIITTHYQNLKQFADNHKGITNAAMLYDRNKMQPLFILSIGNPGSSFAIEIARNIGLPEDVIREASDKVGQDYVQSDKYLQDIARDKQYWERKRQTIHAQEKEMERTLAEYEEKIKKLKAERREILENAKDEAVRLLEESNAQIEQTIKQIKEKQARKEETKKIRQKLKEYKKKVIEEHQISEDKRIPTLKNSPSRQTNAKKHEEAHTLSPLKVGDYIRIKGQSTVGQIETLDRKNALCIFGQIKTRIKTNRLEHAEKPKEKVIPKGVINMSQMARDELDKRRSAFKPELDIRGMRGEEAINTLLYYIDDAIMIGIPNVRILHGKGDGILRHLVRQYLATIPNIKNYRDESVQFGGAGITVVDL